MANNYEQPGEVIDHAPSEDVLSGQAVVIGTRIGVAQTDVAAGVEGNFSVCHVHRLPKASGEVIFQGDDVYLTSEGVITSTADGNVRAGYAFRSSESDSAAVSVKIN